MSNYDPNDYWKNDIGFLKMAWIESSLGSVCISRNPKTSSWSSGMYDRKVIAMGWGVTSPNGGQPQKLQEVALWTGKNHRSCVND